jgi:multiple sugar transport system ATP-binding protein
MASVRFKNIGKTYHGGVVAVSDLNLTIEDKEFVVFVGPSGCGKTTTLRMVAGLEEITEGEIYIGTRLINDVAPKDRDIAMVFQNYALYPHMTVFDNMAFGLKLRKTPKEEIKRKVNEAARILEIEHLLDRRPKALSGGQRQRVALGRAIVRDPQVFLMDEPLSNLDAKLRAQMRTEITKLHQKLQTTFVYVTHDQVEAMTMATIIVVMKDGLIQQVDSPQNLYDKPNNLFVAGFMGTPQMNFINANVAVGDEDTNDTTGVYLEFGSSRIKLPERKGKKLIDGGYEQKTVTLGIRPESIHDEEVFIDQMKDALVEAKVDVVEMLGSETLLFLTVEGAKQNVVARVNPRSKAKVGDIVKVAFDTNKVHLFDRETEKTIVN